LQHKLLHCFLNEFVADVILSPQAASLFRDNEYTAACNSLIMQCLLSMPWCRWICLGPEACTTFHEAVCHDAGRPPARALSQKVLADTFWVQLPCLLASCSFILTYSYLQIAAVHACQQSMASQAKLLAPLFACLSAHKCSAPAAHHQPCNACKLYVYSMKDVHKFAPKAGRGIVSNQTTFCTPCSGALQWCSCQLSMPVQQP